MRQAAQGMETYLFALTVGDVMPFSLIDTRSPSNKNSSFKYAWHEAIKAFAELERLAGEQYAAYEALEEGRAAGKNKDLADKQNLYREATQSAQIAQGVFTCATIRLQRAARQLACLSKDIDLIFDVDFDGETIVITPLHPLPRENPGISCLIVRNENTGWWATYKIEQPEVA